MHQRIVPGGTIDALTMEELHKVIPRSVRRTRVRASETMTLNAAGSSADAGPLTVYKVPAGAEFEVRRVNIDLPGVTGFLLSANSINVNTAPNFVKYLRSGSLIEYGVPQAPAGCRVPGVQNWGREQGPYLRGGEVFAVEMCLNGAAGNNSTVTVTVEGILTENRQDA